MEMRNREMKWMIEGIKTVLENLADSIGGSSGIGAGVGAVFALINCFFGYRMMRFWIGSMGFIIGILAGYEGARYFVENLAICAVIAIGVGIVVAFLSFRIYQAGIFILCGLLGFALFLGLGKMWFLEYGTIVMIIAAIAGIGIGVAGVLFSRPAIIITTAVSGGMAASQTIFGIFGLINETAMLIAGGILAIAGVAWQFYNTGK